MTVLARYAGEDTTGGATWYEKSMEWAKTNGVSDGTNPNANITREQLVTMMYRYAGSPKQTASSTASLMQLPSAPMQQMQCSGQLPTALSTARTASSIRRITQPAQK